MNHLKLYYDFINESTLPVQSPDWFKNWLKSGIEIPGVTNDVLSNLTWELILICCKQTNKTEPKNESELLKMVKDLNIIDLIKKLGISIEGPMDPNGLPMIGLEDLIPIILLLLTGHAHGGEIPTTCFPDPNSNKQWGDILNKIPTPNKETTEIGKDVVKGMEDVATKVSKGDIGGAIDTSIKKGGEVLGKVLKNPTIFNPNIFK